MTSSSLRTHHDTFTVPTTAFLDYTTVPFTDDTISTHFFGLTFNHLSDTPVISLLNYKIHFPRIISYLCLPTFRTEQDNRRPTSNHHSILLHQKLNESYQGGLGGYSLCLMVISHLQQHKRNFHPKPVSPLSTCTKKSRTEKPPLSPAAIPSSVSCARSVRTRSRPTATPRES